MLEWKFALLNIDIHICRHEVYIEQFEDVKKKKAKIVKRQSKWCKYSEQGRGQENSGRDSRQWYRKKWRKYGSYSISSDCILSSLVITAFRAIVGLRYKVANLRPVGPSQLHRILHVVIFIICTIIFMMKGKMCVSDATSRAILSGTMPLTLFLVGLIRS